VRANLLARSFFAALIGDQLAGPKRGECFRWNGLVLFVGVVIVLAALTDTIWTTLWVGGGAGPITRAASNLGWNLLKAFGSHRLMVIAGPVVLTLAIMTWLFLLWLGWFLSSGRIQDHCSPPPHKPSQESLIISILSDIRFSRWERRLLAQRRSLAGCYSLRLRKWTVHCNSGDHLPDLRDLGRSVRASVCG
jgi:hypothetical protein